MTLIKQFDGMSSSDENSDYERSCSEEVSIDYSDKNLVGDMNHAGEVGSASSDVSSVSSDSDHGEVSSDSTERNVEEFYELFSRQTSKKHHA